MAKFLTNLVLTFSPNDTVGTKYYVSQPFLYQSDVLNRIVTVPSGFPTDLASVPKIPFLYEKFGNKNNYAAVIHDYLYTSGRGVDREHADRVFLEASNLLNPDNKAVNKLMYWAVRVFGASHYQQK